MIALTCPSCGRKLKVKDELAGKRGKCPQCQQTLSVPRAEGEHPPGASQATSGGRSEADAATLPPTSSPGRGEREGDTIAPAGRGAAAGKSSATVTDRAGSGPPAPNPELYDFLAPAQAADELGRLGSYRVLKLLGAGGMGAVFQAEDPQLKRKVALKVMLPALAASESSRKRFVREAQAAAAISHDHIVHIYQVGEDRGVPFIAMQFLEGESLEDRLHRERRLEMDEVVRIGREAALGLAAAQKRGMIHRDIKPANLWLEGDSGRVKILDFGLARAASEDSHLTQQGAIIGTPAYMSPEQAAGKTVDGRSDLFSLGCALYRMSTGQVPFKGSDTVSTLMAVATENPTPPREVNRRIPPALSDLILELLEKKPNDRLQSAQELAKALAALQRDPEGDTTPRRRTGKTRQRRSAGRRWPLFAGIGGGVAAIVLIVIVLAGGFGGSGPTRDDGKEKPSDLGNLDRGKLDKATSDKANGDKKKPPDGAAEAAAVNRKAAAWVIDRGGTVTVAPLRGGTPLPPVAKLASLPEKAFWVQAIELPDAKLGDDALESLSGLTELETLKLAGNPIRGVGLQFLKEATKLKELDLSGTQLTDEGLKHLAPLKALESLSLEATPVSDPGLEPLRALKRLQHVNLLHTSATEASVEKLKAALPRCLVVTERVVAARVLELGGQIGIGRLTSPKKELMKIPLLDRPDKLPEGRFQIAVIRVPSMASKPKARWPITDADFKLFGSVSGLGVLDFATLKAPPSGLTHLGNLKHLFILALPNAEIPAGKFQALEGMKSLEVLMLPHATIADADLKAIKDLKNLDALMLMDTPISDAGLAHLKGLTNLNVLELVRTRVSDSGLQALAALTQLQRLTLSSTEVAGPGLAHLSGLTRLTSLSLDNTPLGDDGLTHCKHFTKLRDLTVAQTKVTDAGLAHLAGMPSLFSLTLSYTAIGDAGLAHLKRLPRLGSLSLVKTKVTDQGLKHLKELPNLSLLLLSETAVTDAGLEHLSGLTKLSMLNLSKTGITDAGLKHLKPLTNLQTLYVADTQVTENGIRELKTALPKCNVFLK